MSRRRYFVGLGTREVAVDVERLDDGRFRVHVAGEGTPRVLTLLRGGTRALVLAERRLVGIFGASTRDLHVGRARDRLAVAERPLTAMRAGAAAAGEALVRAPMPGRVLKVLVAPGQALSSGTRVAVVEAMKMENELCVSRAGTVKRVLVREGDTVERNAVLLELE